MLKSNVISEKLSKIKQHFQGFKDSNKPIPAMKSESDIIK